MWNSPSLLNAVSLWALWLAAGFGGLAAISGLVGGLAAIRASDITKSEAEIRIAEANARAEEAHLEAVRLRDGLSWRVLSLEQRAVLVDALKHSGLPKVYNTFVGDDPEAASLREQFDAALREAGIETSYFSGWKQAAGIAVLGNPGPDRDALSKALETAGIPHRVEPPSSSFGRDFPALLIGTKPERL